MVITNTLFCRYFIQIGTKLADVCKIYWTCYRKIYSAQKF